jgi:hypothetical protein
MLGERYIVQWVTEWDSNNHITQVLGYCVRDKGSSGWKTLFKHKEEIVCKKICQMLNEEEEHNNVRRT